MVEPSIRGLPVPAGMAPEVAALLPTMETAVALLMDAQPLIGEQVAVFGLCWPKTPSVGPFAFCSKTEYNPLL